MLDNPLILAAMFHPRAAQPGRSRIPNTFDGTIPASTPDFVLGYRLYRHAQADAPLILFFHGNGEIAGDYDDIAPLFHKIGVSFLVADYRGYGWGTGRPLGSTLLPDAEATMKALPQILSQHHTAPARTYIMGRSLGSAPAVHLATKFTDRFQGLILDSAFAHAPSIFARMVMLPQVVASSFADPFENERKMSALNLSLLVIHGERDNLIPVEHGQRLYDASPSASKTLLRVPRAGHNDLLVYALEPYFQAIRTLITQAVL